MIKDKQKYNEYHRKYAAAHKEKHRAFCAKYRKNTMTVETREKIREYQRWYYENVTKPKKAKAALDWIDENGNE